MSLFSNENLYRGFEEDKNYPNIDLDDDDEFVDSLEYQNEKKASIWITKGIYECDEIKENNKYKTLIFWNGQKNGKNDNIVTSGDYLTYVFYREKPQSPFTYLGIIDNKSIYGPIGDKLKPATYSFYVNKDSKSGLVCNNAKNETSCKWKRAACRSLNLQKGNLFSGIVKHK